MKTLEERLAITEARRAKRKAKAEARRQYNMDVREEFKENSIENRIAFHEDCKRWQDTRERLTQIWFPGIAKSEIYQTYVDHNKARHDRIIDRLEECLELEGLVHPTE